MIAFSVEMLIKNLAGAKESDGALKEGNPYLLDLFINPCLRDCEFELSVADIDFDRFSISDLEDIAAILDKREENSQYIRQMCDSIRIKACPAATRPDFF